MGLGVGEVESVLRCLSAHQIQNMEEMKMKLFKFFMVAGVLLAGMVGTSFAAPVQWTTGAGANGHSYEIVISGISWTDAQAVAAVTGSYLATITSAEEQAFIASLAAPYFNAAGDAGFKLGGFQPAGSQEADGNWQWVTSEAWNYANWAGGEPNNTGGNESYLYLDERFGWKWNDYNDIDTFYSPKGYIVESAPVPEPSTIILLGAGLGGLALWRRKKS